MANSKSGNTVNNEKAAKDYPDFVTDLMYKLHGTKSLACEISLQLTTQTHPT